ncbi:hypothetical protein NQ318_010533 [Aromia moschata]|uniref:Uncharacterized protein n=1 Tax=Aromia moschata TaxID=1265417 RepID=A0AAV8YGM1_9CUCU|nr:hypothetical protein NQ318_010533 [Aromia moschata]
MDYLAKHSVPSLPQPPYSPDVAPQTSFSSPQTGYERLKRVMKGWHHGSVQAIQEAMTRELKSTRNISAPCELLMIKKEDFDLVLRETVWKAWEAILGILNTFSYFRNWNDVTKRECSIVARIKSYGPDETILGDGVGFFDSVYFITKGSGYIIENMILKVYTDDDGNNKTYELYVSDEAETNKDEIDEESMRLSKLVAKYADKKQFLF